MTQQPSELIREDQSKLVDAELAGIVSALGLTSVEIQAFAGYINDFRCGYLTAEKLRGVLRLARENHRDNLIVQSRFPRIDRCAKCHSIHDLNEGCREKLKRKQMSRAEALAELHLAETAPPELIRSTYLRLARQFHPDVAGVPGEERMRKINEAYASLTKE